MAVNITAKPQQGVSCMRAPTRYTSGSNTRWMKAIWKITDWLKSEDNYARATGVQITWTLDMSGVSAKKDPKKVMTVGDINTEESSLNLSSLKIGSKTYTRESFYPLTSRKLLSVTADAVPLNPVGVGGKHAKTTRKFLTPAPPVIAVPTFNVQNGVVTANIKTDAGVGSAERYDTYFSKTITKARHSFSKTSDVKVNLNKIYYTRSGEGTAASPYRYEPVDRPNAADLGTYYESSYATTKTVTTGASRSTDFNVSYNAAEYQQMQYDDYILFTVAARSRGYAGRSDSVKRDFYISYPAQPTIKSVSISSRDSYGKATINLRTNSTKEHPVDAVRLEYLPNVPYARAEDIAGDESWTSTNIIDDSKCTALSIAVTELIPSIGNHTWVRIKSYHASEDVLYRYSNYVMLEELETPVAPPSEIGISILDAHAGNDGKSAVVTLGWNKDGGDTYTGTELSWSTELDTWRSTKEPDTFRFEWSDGAIPNTDWHDSATITIKGLSEGQGYYIKARRYLESDTTFYSDYSETKQVLTSELPESIMAWCDNYITRDGSLSVNWTLSSTSMQRSWRVVAANGASIAEGESSAGSVQIDADRLLAFAEDGVVSFRVEASTGSGYVESNVLTVGILDNPTLSVDATTLVTTQPLSFDVAASVACDLIVIVTSQGATGQFPQGMVTQTAGDTIHSDIYSPDWGTYALTEDEDIVAGKTYYVLEDGRYVAVADPVVADLGTYYEYTYTGTDTITLPTGLDFWDKGRYTLSVVAEDRTTGLRSDKVEIEFDIEWANQAVAPADAVTLTVIDQVIDGFHEQSVQITLTPPTGCQETDVYDIYRMDGDVVRVIGVGFPLTFTTKDMYAPFRDESSYNGNNPLYYRVALRTIDGDVEFTDYEYVADGRNIRLDWSGGSLEFPYGLVIHDNYEKDVEFRSHLDGSIDGYWNPNITRKASLSTSVIHLKQPREVALARQLARYAGPVFVRTPTGSAYEADVQITDMSVENRAVAAISIDATEVSLTQEFVLPVPFELEEEE